MRAISALIFEDGTSTVLLPAISALRMRVSMSAIGSLIIMIRASFSPARLHHAGNLPLQRQFTEVNTAEREAANVTAWSSTNLARIGIDILTAVANAHFVFPASFTSRN